MLGLVRLAAIRELRGGWRLLLVATAVLIFAAALSSLPIVYSATTADLALRETIEQSPRAVKHTNHSRSRRPPTSADVAAVDAAAARARATHLAPVGPIVGETRRMSETPQASMRWLRVDTGFEEALPGYLLTAEELRANARLVDGRWSVQTAAEVGLAEVRLIHGRGIGVQRSIVHTVLKQHPAVESYRDAPESHLGATVATLKAGLKARR